MLKVEYLKLAQIKNFKCFLFEPPFYKRSRKNFSIHRIIPRKATFTVPSDPNSAFEAITWFKNQNQNN